MNGFQRVLSLSRSTLSGESKGWDVAQLVEYRTGTLPTQVRFPGAARHFFSRSPLSVQTALRCLYTPVCNRMHLHLCARYRSRSPCQSSVDYGNTKTPSMHRRLGSATPYRWLSPGKATRISRRRIPKGTIQLKKKKLGKREKKSPLK